MNEKQIEGRMGEVEATRYLENLGYKIICNNFRCMQGEIDIIAKDKKEIVFIEVKTRTNKRYGEGREAVNKNKQKHLFNAVKYYLYKYKLELAYVRLDVIEVYIRKREFHNKPHKTGILKEKSCIDCNVIYRKMSNFLTEI